MALEETDLYAVLGLEKGAESSEKEVKKAYRTKALELHPDKRPGDKHAAAEFDQLQKAYEVLVDEKARKAYDAVRRMKKERVVRERHRSDKRQRMVDELNAREKAFARGAAEEQMAKQRLKAEIERLQREAAKRCEAELRARAGAPMNEAASVATGPGPTDINRTLKVSWSRGEEGSGDGYSAEELRSIYSECGVVEDVVIKSGKKRKGTALVVMASVEAAREATRRALGNFSNPLLSVPVSPMAFDAPPPGPVPGSGAGPAPAPTQPPPGGGQTPHGVPPGATSSASAGAPVGAASSAPRPIVGAGFRDYENQTLLKMRKAAEERARLIREMEEQDKRDAEQEEQAKANGVPAN